MKKLAIITGSDIRHYGGGEKYVIELSRRTHGFKTTFFSFREEKDHRITDARLAKLTNARIIYYNTLTAPITLDRIPITLSALRVFGNLKDYDVVMTYDLSITTNLILLLLNRIYKKRLILEVHDPYGIDRRLGTETAFRRLMLGPYNLIRRSVILSFPNIRVINQDDYLFLRGYGYRGHIYFIPLLIVAKKHKLMVNKKEFICLFVGRLSVMQKGIDYLVSIITKTLERDNQIKFHIVGSGAEGEEMVKEIAARYESNVKWLGFASDEELAREYRNASLYILPSRYEGLPASLVEAFCNGLPAVAFNIRGVRDVVKNRVNGKLIHKGDCGKFSTEILNYYKMWKGHKSLNKLKKRISVGAFAKYGLEKILPMLEEMLNG